MCVSYLWLLSLSCLSPQSSGFWLKQGGCVCVCVSGNGLLYWYLVYSQGLQDWPLAHCVYLGISHQETGNFWSFEPMGSELSHSWTVPPSRVEPLACWFGDVCFCTLMRLSLQNGAIFSCVSVTYLLRTDARSISKPWEHASPGWLHFSSCALC